MMNGEQPRAIDLDRLRSDLAEARERVRDLEQLVILAERWYGQKPAAKASSDAPKQPNDAPKGPPRKPPPATVYFDSSVIEGPLAGLGAREAAVQLLKTRGGTWKVDQATKEMLRLGWQTNSPAPETVVRSALMRDRRIERPAPGEFRYRQEPGSDLVPVEPSANGGGQGQPPTVEPAPYPMLSNGS